MACLCLLPGVCLHLETLSCRCLDVSKRIWKGVVYVDCYLILNIRRFLQNNSNAREKTGFLVDKKVKIAFNFKVIDPPVLMNGQD